MQTCMVLPPCRSQTCDSPPPFVTVVQNFGSVTQRATAIAAGRRLRVRDVTHSQQDDFERGKSLMEYRWMFLCYRRRRDREWRRGAPAPFSPRAHSLSPLQSTLAQPRSLSPCHTLTSRATASLAARPSAAPFLIFYCRSCLAASVSRRDDASAAIAVCHHCRLHSSPTPLAPSRASASPLRSSLRSSLHTPAPDSHHRALATRTGASAGRSYNEWRSASYPRGRRRSRSTSTSKAPSSTSGPSSTASDTASSTRARPTRPSSSSCWSR